ncbi:rhomboid-like protein [Streptomyces phyllanthi]|uniref:rhomboid-like protein n=1 Tax=Streptomyces phyllanthi TaxID=1803180 RepID=UPI001D134C8A|nr:rhomboid-like protein [Streptomyces phyllanthi]
MATDSPAARVSASATGVPADGEIPLDGIPQQRQAVFVPTAADGEAPVRQGVAVRAARPPWWRSVRARCSRSSLALLPTPTGTPFTCAYAAVLVLTSLIAEYADPSLVHALHQGSSTDVAHLLQNPVLVLFASALWVAGGVSSPYAAGLLLVLTALERRIGGPRTAGVFLLGHVGATLATEVPIGLSVLVGHLPGTSLHRLDYGISFGVAAAVGALAGVLRPWLGWPLLVAFGGMLVDDLIAFRDPMTNWGHLIALAIGVAAWPVVRRWCGRPKSVPARPACRAVTGSR